MKNWLPKYLDTRVRIVFAAVLAEAIALLTALGIMAGDVRVCHLIVAGGGVLLAVTLLAAYRFVVRPYSNYKKLLNLFISGYTYEGVMHIENPLNEQSEMVLKKFMDIMTTDEYISAGKRHAQYLALQNQINPHFLYNTLEGIRGEALAAGLDNVAEMTEALATFFRYTISNVEKFVTVEDELSNVENYFIIQQFRFGDRLSMSLEYDEADWPTIRNCRLPKLTFQPVVENSIVHGIERKIENGHLKFRFDLTDKRLIITISDDGVGMDETTLQKLNDKLNTRDLNYIKSDGKHSGIGMVNVNNRIKLLFGEEFGLTVYSTPGIGTDVELTLPRLVRRD